MIPRKKFLFLDIDGTLIDNTHKVPPAAVAALKKVSQSGHRLFIASGRAFHEIPKSVMDLPFDGFVCGNGTEVRCRGDILYRKTIANAMLLALSQHLETHHAHIIYTAGHTNYLRKDAEVFVNHTLQAHLKNNDTPGTLDGSVTHFSEDFELTDINKLIYFNFDGDIEALRRQYAAAFDFIPNGITFENNGTTGEIVPTGITKAAGIKKIMMHLGINKSDIIAFGDGYNDLEMLTLAGTGIAMGNAVDTLKNAADHVTTNVDDDGVYNALKYLGLI